jgi:hypothetical protein
VIVARSAEARKIRRELDKELEASGKRVGRTLGWSAAELAVLALIPDEIDRKVDLFEAYQDTTEAKVRVKLSTEMRLLEQSIARLLKQINTQPPSPDSRRTRRARDAANVRWNRDAPVA